eukprot:7048539-Prymnesium_polylepis.2
MSIHCPMACGACGVGECLDVEEECGIWANASECETNARFMVERCPASCDVCPSLRKAAMECDACLALQETTWRCAQNARSSPRTSTRAHNTTPHKRTCAVLQLASHAGVVRPAGAQAPGVHALGGAGQLRGEAPGLDAPGGAPGHPRRPPRPLLVPRVVVSRRRAAVPSLV